MRRILFGIIFTFCVLTTFGQTASEHLTFKGIPIDGTLESFVGKLKKKGYEEFAREKGNVLLQGDFAGYRNCFIAVGNSEDLDLVSRVTVTLPFSDNWNTTYEFFDKLKRMMIEKHGLPVFEKEEFKDKNPSDDYLKYIYTKQGYCNYIAEFDVGIGGKQIKIIGVDEAGISVSITYFDFYNEELRDKKAMDDL